jgi:hypothetical protein
VECGTPKKHLAKTCDKCGADFSKQGSIGMERKGGGGSAIVCEGPQRFAKVRESPQRSAKVREGPRRSAKVREGPRRSARVREGRGRSAKARKDT